MTIYKCDMCNKEMSKRNSESLTIKWVVKVSGKYIDGDGMDKFDLCTECRYKIINILRGVEEGG